MNPRIQVEIIYFVSHPAGCDSIACLDFTITNDANHLSSTAKPGVIEPLKDHKPKVSEHFYPALTNHLSTP
jgi:hypothetical protein